MHCRRSLNNREVIVLDNTRLNEVYVYEQATIDAVIADLQDNMNLDIRPTDQSPVTTTLVHHQPMGVIYQVPHEDDATRDEYYAFFAPLETEDE